MKDNQNKRRKLTDEQVEQMLARAVQKNVPDILQQAASTPVTPLAMVDEILPVQYPRRCPHWQRLAAACLMLLLTGAGIFSWLWFPTRAVVSIEVYPSVALSLNRFSYVINTRANNDDGAELLDDLSLNNLKLDTALNALIGAMDRQGYLTPSAQVNIFVDGKDDDYNSLCAAELYAKDNPDYQRNVAALTSVLPPKLEAGDVSARIGVSWVDVEDYQALTALSLTKPTTTKTVLWYRR